jgi:hypothetical protein
MILKHRYLFPAVYPLLLVPSIFTPPVKGVVIVVYAMLAMMISARAVGRLVILFVTACCTLLPLLLLVQGTICSSSIRSPAESFAQCAMQRSILVLFNMGLLSSVFLLAGANEWRGSMVATINGLYLPRSVRIIAIAASAMIWEFRHAAIRVYHAFTARGEAMPSPSWRNLVVLPAMLGTIWASVLSGVVERIKGQWSSEDFWATYVCTAPTGAVAPLSDTAILCVAGFMIAASLAQFAG